MTTAAISSDALLANVLWLMSKNLRNDLILVQTLIMPVICKSDNSQLDKFKYSSNGLAVRTEVSSFAASLLLCYG